MKTVSAFLLFASFAAGCSSRVLTVTDGDGKPVEGAIVMPYAPSINGPVVMTDAEGKTEIPERVAFQNIVGCEISKPGFEDGHIDVTDGKPLHATLKPARSTQP